MIKKGARQAHRPGSVVLPAARTSSGKNYLSLQEGQIFANLSFMEGQVRDLFRQKILDAEATSPPAFTRRDVHVPKIPGKAVAVIGMRRSGKTTFLWQVLSERLAAGMPREGILFFSFNDERLVGLKASDLAILLEEYYRLHPE